MVKALLDLNDKFNTPIVEVIIMSRDSPETGLRVFNSIEKLGLGIVRAAFTAALIYDVLKDYTPDDKEIRIAFDGDAVVFSDESENIYRKKGLDAFLEHEKANAEKVLKAFNAHIFFDDQDTHVMPASSQIPSGRVQYKTDLDITVE